MVKPGYGKQKGSQFERDTGNLLSIWISCGERDDLFRRTVLSGGQYTNSIKGEKVRGVAGDLDFNHPDAIPFTSKWAVECKWWAYLELLDFTLCRGELYNALLKIQVEAFATKRNWMLIAKQNNRPILLFLPNLPNLNVNGITHHTLFNNSVYMLKLEEFLEHISWEAFKDLV